MKILRIAAAALVAAAAGVLIMPNAASAHGAMMKPGSRTWLCYQDGKTANGAITPKNPACAAAVAKSGVTSLYNWFAVLRSDGAGRVNGFIPDGQLCSGGTGGPYDFTGYNLGRSDWPVSHLTAGKQIEVDYNDWAKHPGTFSLYITKDGYDPTKPLSWGDLESTPFNQSTNPPADGGPGTDAGHYYWNATLPSGKSGRHLIYSVWSRSDSTETFYNCSDVVFDGGNGEVTGVGDSGSSTPPSSSPPVSVSPSVSTSPSRSTSPSVSVSPSRSVSSSPSASTGTGTGACSASFKLDNSWGGGFQATVTVQAGTSALSKWSVSWTWPGSQTLNQVWSGTSTVSGSLVTVKNANWNGTVNANGSTQFGLIGNGTAPTTVPNLACSVA
jgi:predicted carbohydrate-binding protein with CBM5 and CBM33 domain